MLLDFVAVVVVDVVYADVLFTAVDVGFFVLDVFYFASLMLLIMLLLIE